MARRDAPARGPSTWCAPRRLLSKESPAALPPRLTCMHPASLTRVGGMCCARVGGLRATRHGLGGSVHAPAPRCPSAAHAPQMLRWARARRTSPRRAIGERPLNARGGTHHRRAGRPPRAVGRARACRSDRRAERRRRRRVRTPHTSGSARPPRARSVTHARDRPPRARGSEPACGAAGRLRSVRPPRASLAAHTRAAMIGVRSGSGARRCVRPLARSAPTGRDAPRPRACRSEPACGAAGRAERANASHERLFSAATRTIGHARAQSPPTRVRLRASVRSGGARAERAAASRERLRSAATRAIGRARTVGRARARGPRAQAAVIGVRSGGARASTSSQHPSPLRARGRTVQRST